MTVTIFVNIIAVFFALLASFSKNPKKSLFVSFFIVFIFLAFRYNFGNDYNEYHDYFIKVHKASIKDLTNLQEYQSKGLMEVGYTWLNRLFDSFYLMVALLSLFSCYVYYKIIKTYAKPNLIWFSVFIFLFDATIMLIQSSSIRQTIAICLFLLSLEPLIKRKFLKYSILVLSGCLFHFSAIILFPLYFLITQNRWNKLILISLVILYFLFAFLGYLFLPFIERIALLYFPRYKEAYMKEIIGNNLGSSLGFLFWSSIFIYITWAHNRVKGYDIILSKLTIIAFLLSPISMYLSMFSRILMYFDPFIILSLPSSVSQLKSQDLRGLFISVLVLWYLMNFYLFFQDPVWKDQFANYQINIIHGR